MPLVEGVALLYLTYASAAAFLLVAVWLYRAPPNSDVRGAHLAKRAAQRKAFADAGHDPHDATLAGAAPSAEELVILEKSAAELAAAMRAGVHSPAQVMTAFQRQTVRAQHRFNCVTEVAMADARRRAAELPTDPATPATALLYGVPVSVKDSVGMRGLDQTLGLANAVDRGSADDSVLVQALRRAGAVPFVKSNVPQTMLSFECSNPLFGRSVHPTHPHGFTPGGSSGGEAVLAVTRGSACGIGTDIGGSVRIPAHFSGCTALKPTGRRTSMVGFRPSVPGQEAVVGVPGPMATTTEDLVLLCRALWTREVFAVDHDLVPLPFDTAEYDRFANAARTGAVRVAVTAGGGDAKAEPTRPLRIGYYTHDGFVTAVAPCARAVQQTVDDLAAAGHTVVPWQPPRIVDAVGLFYSLLTADRARTVKKALVGEPLEPYVKFFLRNMAVPHAVRRFVAYVLERATGDRAAARLFASAVDCDTTRLWELHKLRKDYRQEFFTAFQAQRLDALVCPAHALPAIRHGGYTDITFSCSYTLLYNLLDWPAGVVPVTHVSDADATAPAPVYPPGFAPGLLDRKVARAFEAGLRPDPAAPNAPNNTSRGLPVGVQVVTPPFTDERCLGVMRVIEASRSKATRHDFLCPKAVAGEPVPATAGNFPVKA